MFEERKTILIDVRITRLKTLHASEIKSNSGNKIA